MAAPLSDAHATFGARLRAHRHAAQLSQERLAQRVGLHWTFIGQVERGQRNLSLQNILRLAAGLEIDPAELVQGLVPDELRPNRSTPT